MSRYRCRLGYRYRYRLLLMGDYVNFFKFRFRARYVLVPILVVFHCWSRFLWSEREIGQFRKAYNFYFQPARSALCRLAACLVPAYRYRLFPFGKVFFRGGSVPHLLFVGTGTDKPDVGLFCYFPLSEEIFWKQKKNFYWSHSAWAPVSVLVVFFSVCLQCPYISTGRNRYCWGAKRGGTYRFFC